ncbi:hypothetical protein BLNAU_20881 [Blattamonas nauphoetae]|uniref:Uncharacterized protein n=1 Tax=Blattamonas nauphoetae TaxID=2049346 RepID=A0ABQ9WXK5_9EUKA|nr:hypothetical protein BLNAU_20881 [Blattamonas nauphoetae]
MAQPTKRCSDVAFGRLNDRPISRPLDCACVESLFRRCGTPSRQHSSKRALFSTLSSLSSDRRQFHSKRQDGLHNAAGTIQTGILSHLVPLLELDSALSDEFGVALLSFSDVDPFFDGTRLDWPALLLSC